MCVVVKDWLMTRLSECSFFFLKKRIIGMFLIQRRQYWIFVVKIVALLGDTSFSTDQGPKLGHYMFVLVGFSQLSLSSYIRFHITDTNYKHRG